jgi:glycosyltransferase involved in cell wall biosynthesis
VIAYLINQYPKVSHSFIRREIVALEELGTPVLRVSLRGWDADLADPADVEERSKTTYLLRGGLGRLVAAGLATMLTRPTKALRTLALAMRLSRGSDRSLPYHLVYLLEAAALVRLLDRRGIRHLHAHFGTNPAEIATLARCLGGPPFSFTVHGPEEFDRPGELKLRQKGARAAAVVAISHYCRSQLSRFMDPADVRKIAIVHCGLDAAFLDAAPVAPRGDGTRLVCVGRLCPEKAQPLLIRAIAALRDRGTRIDLVLAGDGDLRAECNALIAEHQLQDQIVITGWIGSHEVRRLLESADALVLPSLAEGLPVVIMEAMALGRPVITTWIAAIPELVRPGLDGFLVAPGDEEGLVDAIARFVALDPAQRLAMGDRARRRVRQDHTAWTEAGRLQGLFNGLVATRP